jgi:stage II sporulation protein GA (sporulation sigma-E factor processing peptidase)
MKIFVELTIFVSMSFNYFILKTTSLIARKQAKNIFLSSFLGSLVSLAYPLFCILTASKIILIFSLLVILMCLSFNFSSIKDFFQISCIFILTTFSFGGASIAIENVFGKISLFIILFGALFMFFLCKLVIKFQQRKNRIKDFSYVVKIKDNGKEIEEEGFLDSGNMLYDNITKKPVILISYDVFKKLYSQISMTKLLTKSIDKSSIKNGHYIRINSIGNNTSLLIFTIDQLEVNNICHEDVMVGLSFSGFEKSFGKNILLHSELV